MSSATRAGRLIIATHVARECAGEREKRERRERKRNRKKQKETEKEKETRRKRNCVAGKRYKEEYRFPQHANPARPMATSSD